MCAASVTPAHANIYANMTECQVMQASQADVFHGSIGVWTGSAIATPRYVACPVPRSPLASGNAVAEFFVTGSHTDSVTTTTCTLFAYDYTGAFLGSTSFTRSGRYVQAVQLPAAQVGLWAYTSLTCLLPANGRGTLESAGASQASSDGQINTNATACQLGSW